jgi:nucleotide-binding universal stress UspA family protein
MFTNILLAVDGSAQSVRAAGHGIELAKAVCARVTLLTVTTPWEAYFSREIAVLVPDAVVPRSEYETKRETMAACLLQDLAADARSAGLQVRTLHRADRDPYRAIIETAEREGCDLIVVGSHRGVGPVSMMLESETMRVLTHTLIPVLVYRNSAQA